LKYIKQTVGSFLVFNTIIKILNDIELTTFPCDPRQLNKILGMILYPAQFPGINLEFQGFQGFSRTKIKIQSFPGFPGAV
jgi:hypothetical protein